MIAIYAKNLTDMSTFFVFYILHIAIAVLVLMSVCTIKGFFDCTGLMYCFQNQPEAVKFNLVCTYTLALIGPMQYTNNDVGYVRIHSCSEYDRLDLA